MIVIQINIANIPNISPSCIENCPPSWIANVDHCYHIVKPGYSITRDDASKMCKRDSATLASVTSENEQQFLVKYRKGQGFGGYDMWIGGQKNDGSWKWDDGSSFSYKNWDDGAEESSKYGSNPCNYMNDNNKWRIGRCDWKLHLFACKKIRKYHVNRKFECEQILKQF